MRASEFVNEGFRDWVGKNIYKLTGVDDKYGGRSMGAGRDRFIGNFVSYFKQVLQSAQSSNTPLDVQAMVNSYLAKNKWAISNNQQKAAVDAAAQKIEQSNFSNSAIKELANLMYVIGAEQVRDQYGATVSNTQGPAQANNTTAPAPTDTTASAPTGDNPVAIPKGKVVELNGKQYQWQGAQWALYNPMTGKASQMAPKALAAELNKLAMTPAEPMTPDAIAQRRAAKLKAAQAKADAQGVPIKRKKPTQVLTPQQKFEKKRIRKQKQNSATAALTK